MLNYIVWPTMTQKGRKGGGGGGRSTRTKSTQQEEQKLRIQIASDLDENKLLKCPWAQVGKEYLKAFEI